MGKRRFIICWICSTNFSSLKNKYNFFPLITTRASGNLQTKSNTNLTFNSSTGTLSSTSFSGDGSSLSTIKQHQITYISWYIPLDWMLMDTLNVQNGNSLDFGTATNNNKRTDSSNRK